MEENNQILADTGKQQNFMLDTSAILYFQTIWKNCGASIFTVFKELPDVNFYVCNEVLSELIGGKNGFAPTQLGPFLGHILNAESSMVPGWKENRFLIQENGETKFIVLNKISSTDYAQILLCQNHSELVLVANDRRMIKSGAQVLENRMIGIPAMLKRLRSVYPNNPRLKTIQDTGDAIFEKKHAFGDKGSST